MFGPRWEQNRTLTQVDRPTDRHRPWRSSIVPTPTLAFLNLRGIFAPDGQAVGALHEAGFQIPHGRELLRATNVGVDERYYDQIAYLFRDQLDLEPTRIGVVDPFEAVYTDAKFEDYRDELRTAGGAVPADPERYYRVPFAGGRSPTTFSCGQSCR